MAFHPKFWYVILVILIWLCIWEMVILTIKHMSPRYVAQMTAYMLLLLLVLGVLAVFPAGWEHF